MAGLPLDDIYSEGVKVSGMQMEEKLEYLNKLYLQQEDRDRTKDYNQDILKEHDQEYLKQIQLKDI